MVERIRVPLRTNANVAQTFRFLAVHAHGERGMLNLQGRVIFAAKFQSETPVRLEDHMAFRASGCGR